MHQTFVSFIRMHECRCKKITHTDTQKQRKAKVIGENGKKLTNGEKK